MDRAYAKRGWLGLGALVTFAASAALIVLLVTPAGFADNTSEHANPLTAFPGANWPTTGGDLANSRYSTLTQITRGNVKNLVRAWSTPINPGFQTGAVESPPIVSGTTLFASSSRGAPAALDSATGKLKWVTDPSTINTGPSRGLASSANGAARRLAMG